MTFPWIISTHFIVHCPPRSLRGENTAVQFFFLYYRQDCIHLPNCHFVLYSHPGVILTGFIALWNIHKERSILPQPLPSIFYCLQLSFLSIISLHASGTQLVVTHEGIKAAAYVDSHLYIIVVFISFYIGRFLYIDSFLSRGCIFTTEGFCSARYRQILGKVRNINKWTRDPCSFGFSLLSL